MNSDEALRRIVLATGRPAASRYARIQREREIQAELMALHGGINDQFWADAELIERQIAALDAAAARDPEAAQERYEAMADDPSYGLSDYVGQESPEDFAEMAAHYHSSFAPKETS